VRRTTPADLLVTGRSALLAGGLASVAVALVLYSRYHLDGTLGRDEGIYAYGGQQMLHGVPPYKSIFDPKGPLATMLCGLGAGLGRLLGTSDVTMIRLVFFASAVLTVLAVYLLVTHLWYSPVGGFAAAAVFACFRAFARDALPGPDAKTPGVLFAVLAMWLLVRRRWFLAAFAAAAACLVWQPLFAFPLMCLVCPVLWSAPGERWPALRRAVAGTLTPIAATLVYFAATGAVGASYEAAFAYPLTGVRRGSETYFGRIRHIASVVDASCGPAALLFWVGLALLVAIVITALVRSRTDWRAALADPVLSVVAVTAVLTFGYATLDFQAYPDVLPLLPYPAIGCGAAVAIVLRHVSETAARVVVAATLVAAAVATVLSAVWFTDDPANDHYLRVERAEACAVQRVIPPDTRLYALGSPVPLVLTQRRNPDPFIYLYSGVAAWKVHHTKGGFDAWMRKIPASRSSVVVIDQWDGPLRPRVDAWLTRHGYSGAFVGRWRVYATSQAQRLAADHGVRLTARATQWPHAAGCARR
jgi:hypothetical protein